MFYCASLVSPRFLQTPVYFQQNPKTTKLDRNPITYRDKNDVNMENNLSENNENQMKIGFFCSC